MQKPIALALLLAFSAPALADTVVRLGFAGPLTGPQAHLGKDMENGIRLALEDANAEGIRIGGEKARFELIAEDDQADPRSATQVAQRLAEQKLSGMLGHFNSGTSIPASRIYAQAGLPQIAMATAPAYTRQGLKTTFRAMTSDSQQGSVIGRYVVQKLGVRQVAIIDDRTAYGQGLADEFEKAVKAAGAKVVRREYTHDKATDFTAILTSIRAARPDMVFYGGFDAQSGPMVKQMKRLGIKARFASGEGSRTDAFVKLAGAEGEDVIASLAGVPLEKMPEGKRFEQRFTAKYGNMDIYAPYAYDAARNMIAAMQKANSSDPARYLPALASIERSGVTSPKLAYDRYGDLKSGAITVYQLKAGQWVVLETLGGA